MHTLYHWLRTLFKRKQRRKLSLDEIATHLPAEAKTLLAKEIAILKGVHGVEVHSLAPGEVEGKPRAADPAIEQELQQRQVKMESSAP